jgi:hypothetical protein
LEGVGIGRQFLPQHLCGSGGRGAAKCLAAPPFDGGYHGFERMGFASAGIPLKNRYP